MCRRIACSLVLFLFVSAASVSAQEAPVGLSLSFDNGAGSDIARIGNPRRYVQEVDIISTVTTDTDQGIEPVIDGGDLASADWSGIELVEEDWRAPGDGTWTRMRFYRGAAWMRARSTFVALGMDARGRPVGPPLIALAGRDDRWRTDRGPVADDGFVRRFNARQITTGCRAKFDCSNATRFVAQALVQFRNALHPQQDARRINPRTQQLALWWSAQPGRLRTLSLVAPSPEQQAYGYGFEPDLELINAPANGEYYVPGEAIRMRITLRDGDGNRLHPPGSLPTYGEFVRGEIPSGLRYFDGFRLEMTTYYALKHREGNSIVALSGPLDRLRVPRTVVGIEQFFLPQAVSASVMPDGFTGLAVLVPNTVFPGALGDPALWDQPVSDEVMVVLPTDALPGTYVAAVKFRREFAGESLNRVKTINLQVGTSTPTPFDPSTGPCTTCHSGESTLGNILHGLSDRSACYGCHSGLAFEPDGALDIRVHMVHSRSNRFPGDVQDCGLCHTRPPAGPFRDSGEDGATIPLLP